VISDQGGSVIGNNGGSYRLVDVQEAALAGAEVYLTDAAGKPIASLAHARTGADGRYSLAGVPAEATVVVNVAVRTAAGQPATLQTVAAPGASGDVGLATTLVASRVLRAGPAAIDGAAFHAAVVLVGGALDAVPDVADRDAMAAEVDALAGAKPELARALGWLASPAPSSPAASNGIPAPSATAASSPTPGAAATAASSAPPPSPAPRALKAFEPGPTLTGHRTFHTSHVIGGWLYLLGGTDAAAGSVERAAVNPDGTLGPFGAAGQLAVARRSHASVVVGNAVYVIGGTTNDTDRLTSVERAPINADGSLGPFAQTASQLATGRLGAAAVVTSGYVYVLGGNVSGATATVERAPINADGSLGSFTVLPDAGAGACALADARYDFVVAQTSGYVYLLGGYDNVAPYYLRTIERAPLLADGGLGAFTLMPTNGPGASALEVAAEAATGAAVDDMFYLFGGYSPAGFSASVQVASIAPDGTLGTFQVLAGGPTLPTPLARAAATASGDGVYLTGGLTGPGTYQDACVRAAFARP
jgi:hypothetical protein